MCSDVACSSATVSILGEKRKGTQCDRSDVLHANWRDADSRLSDCIDANKTQFPSFQWPNMKRLVNAVMRSVSSRGLLISMHRIATAAAPKQHSLQLSAVRRAISSTKTITDDWDKLPAAARYKLILFGEKYRFKSLRCRGER